MRPSYRISPFSTRDISNITCNSHDPNAQRLISNFFYGHEYKLTESGRTAIEIALMEISLKKSDTVTILTTSNNYYVSSCVTNAIEKHCQWNRIIGPDTSVIFVIHEFGSLYKTVASLKEYDVPIIEDYAHSFASISEYTNGVSNERFVGDYVIFSFPKFIPVQFGGAIVSTNKNIKSLGIEEDKKHYLMSTLANNLQKIDEISSLRRIIYQMLVEQFSKLGGTPYFEYLETEIPGAFLFKLDLSQDVLQRLKMYTQSYGIESSVYYGENAFFIPCHQRLTYFDVEYFFEIVNGFIKENLNHDTF